MKQKIYQFVVEKSQQIQQLDEAAAVIATEICDHFTIKRNTASKYLNELVEESLLIKINSRPVYFFSRNFVETVLDHKLEQDVYASLNELKCKGSVDVFDQVIGRNDSLKETIEQLISAAIYPEGLPILLHGESGTGKSMLARLVYEYSLAKQILTETAPFIVFNCAQYYNNPELLSSQLFGYKRGAFTGADSDRGGLIEEAEGGILFLDEVHRLSPEGQEKLFILMDQKVFSRVGETDNLRKANVRLIFATTEEVQVNFLPTFLRRIPMICHLPNFAQRTYQERQDLIYLMLKKEASVLQCSLRVSSTVIHLLTHAQHKGNIGEVENVIKRVCAREYSLQRGKNPVDIRRNSVPEEILLANLDLLNEKKFLNEPVLFTPAMEIRVSKEITLFNRYADKMIRRVLKLFKALQTEQLSFVDFQEQAMSELYSFIDQLIFNDVSTSQEILNYMIRQVQETFQLVMHAQNHLSNGNDIFMIANYLLKRTEALQFNVDKDELQELYQFLYKMSKQNTPTLFQLLENNLDLSLSQFDRLFIMLTQVAGKTVESKAIGGLIIAHGYATASSISSVVNRMLKAHIFDSFDMPLDVSVDELIERIQQYVASYDYQEGLLVLVDMGSLHNIGKQLVKNITSPIVLINNVSTEMALWGGNLIQQKQSILEISEKMKETGKIHCQLIYPEKKTSKAVIISCSTGFGTAIKLKELFTKIVPAESELQFIAQDFEQLKQKGFETEVFKTNEVIGLIGTADPQLENLPYISIEDLFSDQDNRLLKLLEQHTSKELAEVVNNEMIKNLSLNKIIDSLTILDSNKVISQIEPCIETLERFINHKLNNNQKLTLYVHVSCMIERLIRNQQMDTMPQDEDFLRNQQQICSMIQTAFHPIEQLYNITLPVEEAYYIYNITQNFV